MSIWSYQESSQTPPLGHRLESCVYCRTALVRLPSGGAASHSGKRVEVCPVCGWWAVTRVDEGNWGLDCYLDVYRGAGTLRHLALSDVSVPTQEVRQYLTAKYGDRHLVHPRKYEEIVAAVFRDFGYRVRVTSYSGDDGVDVFVFDGEDDAAVAIQVKRTKNAIEAHQIREFAGALVLNGSTRGIFITTEDFTRGAERTATRYQQRGLAVSLWDADTFYDSLKLTTRARYFDADDPDAPFAALWANPAEMPNVYHESGGAG